MRIIGLTGGIGSGKSTVADLFSKLGAPIIDSDVIAREVLMEETPLKKIVAHFGTQILDAKAQLDRTKLRKLIFENATQREWLENLLHPLIIAEIKKRIATLHTAYCIVVIPLLMEVPEAKKLVDRILVVDASEELQIQRTVVRDHSTPEEVKRILASQINRAQRLKIADDVVSNTGDIAALQEAVSILHQRYSLLEKGAGK